MGVDMGTCHDRRVQSAGKRAWSITLNGVNATLTHALAVRTVADLPAYDADIPEPLTPEPPPMRIPPSAAVRSAAAPQWAAWWPIVWAQNIARHREAPVQPDRPLFGLDPLYETHPPKFSPLASAPELRQIVATTWSVLSIWMAEISEIDHWGGEDGWPRDLVARADKLAGRPIGDVDVRLEILPVAGLRHWVQTEDPDRRLLHAVVTPELAHERRLLDRWLIDALRGIG